MKLEEGMYVRTKDGAIAKVEQIVDDEIHFNIKPIFSDGECLGYNWFYIKDVIKASHNIIDLIEVGDVIEVKEFKGKYEVRQFGLELSIVKLDTIYNLNSLHCTLNIKSIVTKEQFEQMEYKVGE